MPPFAHPHDCPSWEYEDHPDHEPILAKKTIEALISLRTGELDTLSLSLDTRSIHTHLFSEVTPDGYTYFAGHYRGEEFRCLKYYEVYVPADSRVGISPNYVYSAISYLSNGINTSVAAIDEADKLPEAALPKEQKILYLVALVSRIFVEFLRIHPYANGNGHMGRFIVFSLLGRYGFWPKKWPVDDHPPDPPYSDLIKRYRDGDRNGLEKFVLNCILGNV